MYTSTNIVKTQKTRNAVVLMATVGRNETTTRYNEDEKANSRKGKPSKRDRRSNRDAKRNWDINL